MVCGSVYVCLVFVRAHLNQRGKQPSYGYRMKVYVMIVDGFLFHIITTVWRMSWKQKKKKKRMKACQIEGNIHCLAFLKHQLTPLIF